MAPKVKQSPFVHVRCRFSGSPSSTLCPGPVSHPNRQERGFSYVFMCSEDREKDPPALLAYSGCLLPSEPVSIRVLMYISAVFPFGGKPWGIGFSWCLWLDAVSSGTMTLWGTGRDYPLICMPHYPYVGHAYRRPVQCGIFWPWQCSYSSKS